MMKERKAVSVRKSRQFLISVPWSHRTQVLDWTQPQPPTYAELLETLVFGHHHGKLSPRKRQRIASSCYWVHHGTVIPSLSSTDVTSKDHTLAIHCRIRGGMDRQNRVGSKFGGGGVSSAQQAERERKERLKKLALESIDLAKDPYLVRNHLGSYECKLCLTLHRDEANYLAHTQGKKHQAGLARRAFLEKQRQQQEQSSSGNEYMGITPTAKPTVVVPKIKIGRPAYQVFKSRDSTTHQRCLSFELCYPELSDQWQPRHRFMSAFEQRVDSPPDKRYQYLLFAAGDYETVAFRIPNEPLDKDQERFVTHWDKETKKFTLTLHFLEPGAKNN